MDRHVAGPGQRARGHQDIDLGAGAGPPCTMRDIAVAGAAGLRQVARQVVRLAPPSPTGRRGAPAARAAQPGEAERQQGAALGAGQRMQLVEHDAAQLREDRRAHRRRRAAAPGSPAWSAGCPAAWSAGAARAVRRRVAGAGLDADRQAHLRDRARQVALRCRWPAPSAARCRACAGRSRRPLRPARPGWAGTRPASCRRRWARSAGRPHRLRGLQHLHLVGVRRPARD